MPRRCSFKLELDYPAAAGRRGRGRLRAAGGSGRRRGLHPRPRQIPSRHRRFQEFAAGEARGALRQADQGRGVGVGVASVEEIDTINIYWARMLAMTRAVEALGIEPAWVLVDGNATPKLAAAVEGDRRRRRQVPLDRRRLDHRQGHSRPDDGRACETYPGYGWERNRGYPTPDHRRALRELGPTPLHRRSFGLVREMIAAAAQPELQLPEIAVASPLRHTTTG